MKKKMITLMLGAMLTMNLFACGGNTSEPKAPAASTETEIEAATETEIAASTETEAAPEETEAAPAETEAAPEEEITVTESEVTADASSPFVDEWYEPIAQRGYVSVTTDADGVFYFEVNWPDSAFESYHWSFSGKLNEADVITYSNCTKTLSSWDENDKETVTVVGENTAGSVYLDEDDHLVWVENDRPEEENIFWRESALQ